MLKRVTRSNDNEFQISALEFDFKTFLEVYRESVKIYSLKNFKKYSGDVALYYLLVANYDNIKKDLPFEKNAITEIQSHFRKFNVTKNEETDTAIWTLMSSSELFWDVLRSLADGKDYSEDF